MTVTIRPGTVRGQITAPPSKSMAHRMLIGAGLAQGVSVIRGISRSEDMGATLDCLAAADARCRRDGDTVTVTGADWTRIPKGTVLPCRESGSTLRFLIPLCLLGGGEVTFTGSETLMSRPLSVYEEICRRQGLHFAPSGRELTVGGTLAAGEYRIRGNISSQFVTGLLYALPLLPQESRIVLRPPVESRSYIGLTLRALSAFGVTAQWEDERTLTVPGGQRYTPVETAVEGDYSNAAFFAALNVLGSEVTILGLDPDSLQGDRVYTHFFDQLQKGTPTIHIADCPDLGPVLFAVAAACSGGVFTGTRRLRLKESDRAAAMAEELAKCGVAVTVHEDSVVVYPHDLHPPKTPLCGHNDHRIVMALSVLLTRLGGQIEGAEAVAKSMPDFFDVWESLGFEVERI